MKRKPVEEIPGFTFTMVMPNLYIPCRQCGVKPLHVYMKKATDANSYVREKFCCDCAKKEKANA